MTDASCRSPDLPAPLRPRDALAALVRDWRRERALRATVRTLEDLDDHTLRDIGMHRGDLVPGVRRVRSDG